VVWKWNAAGLVSCIAAACIESHLLLLHAMCTTPAWMPVPACLQLPVSLGNKRRRDLVDKKHEHGEMSAKGTRKRAEIWGSDPA
jgi:hypothetical protein